MRHEESKVRIATGATDASGKVILLNGVNWLRCVLCLWGNSLLLALEHVAGGA